MKIRGELRLIERAIKQGWPTSPEKQAESVELILATLRDPERTQREKATAMRCCTALIESDGARDSEIKKRLNDALRYYKTTPTTTDTAKEILR